MLISYFPCLLLLLSYTEHVPRRHIAIAVDSQPTHPMASPLPLFSTNIAATELPEQNKRRVNTANKGNKESWTTRTEVPEHASLLSLLGRHRVGTEDHGLS